MQPAIPAFIAAADYVVATAGDLMRKLIVVAERGCLVTTTLKDAVAITTELEGE